MGPTVGLIFTYPDISIFSQPTLRIQEVDMCCNLWGLILAVSMPEDHRKYVVFLPWEAGMCHEGDLIAVRDGMGCRGR